MYSRYHDGAKRPIQLPEHYNGCAFAPARAETPPEPAAIATEPEHHHMPREAPAVHTPPVEASTGTALTPLAGLLHRARGEQTPFFGLGFDELLLLGLILLVAGTEDSTETVLCLVLLLLCG